jgi:hypothetical protein
VVSNFSSRHLLKRIERQFRQNSNFPLITYAGFSFLTPEITFSDNWSFWKFGYKAVMITDTALFRNPYYHTSQDTFEKLNYEYMSAVTAGLYQVLLKLGSDI